MELDYYPQKLNIRFALRLAQPTLDLGPEEMRRLLKLSAGIA